MLQSQLHKVGRSEVYPQAMNKEKVEPLFGAPPGKALKVRFLETKLRCEVESPRTAGAEDAGSARGRSVDYILNYVWRFTLLCESDGRWVSKVSYVEDIEDFADKIEFQPFVEAEGLC